MVQLISHVQTPLYRNAYALILSNGLTSGLGLVYWVLAARLYPAEVLGLNATAISAMVFLSGLGLFKLNMAMMRFIPQAGQATGRLIGYAYLSSTVATAVIGLMFVHGLAFLAPTLGFLSANPLFTLWFISGTILWSIFALQDGVLTGLREAMWIPIENATYGLAKLALLIFFSHSFPQYGILASWTIPTILWLLPVNVLIFRRLVPIHVRASKDRAVPLVSGQIIKYAGGNYIGSLFFLASIRLMPVIVASQAGNSANAYFYLPWTIAISLQMISTAMVNSLTVEGARDQTKLNTYASRLFVNVTLFVLPIVVGVLLGAPHILRLSGGSYAAEGTTLLRLLSIAVLPNIVSTLYMGVARVHGNMRGIVLVQAFYCVLVLSLSFALLRLYGITGVGIAVLASETAVAVILLLTELRAIVRPILRQRCRSSS